MTNQDLIRQYVNTGLGISKYQYNKLSTNLKKSYLRQRSKADDDYSPLEDWEFLQFSDDDVKKVSDSSLTNLMISSEEPVTTAKFYIEKKGKELTHTDIFCLCKYIFDFESQNEVISLILENKGEFLDSSDIYTLMRTSIDKVRTLKLILEYVAPRLEDGDLRTIFFFAKDWVSDQKEFDHEKDIKNLLLNYFPKQRLNKVIQDEKSKFGELFRLDTIP